MSISCTVRVPKYRHHKGSGQAFVQRDGRRFYLGKYGSEESQERYRRFVAEMMVAAKPTTARPEVERGPREFLTVIELLAKYWRFAQRHYCRDGQQARSLDNIRDALRPLRNLYGHTRAADFGPLALKAVRQSMVADGLARKTVNNRVGMVKQVFAWAVSEELVPPSAHHALVAVKGLQKGRTTAAENAPVQPVPEVDFQATLPHMPAIIADMALFQRLTGCRPAEVCILRPRDVDRSTDVWGYVPSSHKTEHHGRERVIFIGPKAQAILRPYLLREAETFCFSPVDTVKKQLAEKAANRNTPLSCGNRPGTNRKRKPKTTAGECYTAMSYRRAVTRACDAAFPPPAPLAQRDDETAKQWADRLTERQAKALATWQAEHRWSPNRLRHSAGTEIRKRFGLEAAQVTLGHASADITQVYAERDFEKAAEVMRAIG